MNVTMNNQWRDFVYRCDVPEAVVETNFDWTDAEDGFLKYRKCWYHISMFMRIPMEGWDGIYNDSMFSGVLLSMSSDGEQYKIATVTT